MTPLAFRRLLPIAAATCVSTVMLDGQQTATISPFVDLLSASIEQHPPFTTKNVPDRAITIRFVVAGRPSCTTATSSPAYTLLVDAFPWQRAHMEIPSFPELRFQSAIAITCDPATGALRSNIRGTIAVEAASEAAGAQAIALRTTLGQLPAVEFRWIAVASDGDRYTRAPASGSYARWAIHERTLR